MVQRGSKAWYEVTDILKQKLKRLITSGIPASFYVKTLVINLVLMLSIQALEEFEYI